MKTQFLIILVFFYLSLSTWSQQKQESAIDSSIVALWHFDEASGNVLHDASIYGNNGEIHFATWTNGKFGSALHFNGVNSFISLPNSSPLKLTENFTVECWFSVDSIEYNRGTNDFPSLLGNLGPYPYGGGWIIYMKNHSEIGFSFRNNNSGSSFASLIPVNSSHQFYHLAVVYKRIAKQGYINDSLTCVKTYINGTMKDSAIFSNKIQYNQAMNFYIGSNIDGRPVGGGDIREFLGIIDEIRISNVARDPSEFGLDYLAAVPGRLDYGFVEVGQSFARQLKLYNTSTTDTITVDSVSIGNDAFSYTGALGAVPPHDSLTLEVTYAPLEAGIDATTMRIAVHGGDFTETNVELLGKAYTGGMDTNVVADWHFDEGAGNILHDASLYENDGNIGGNTQWVQGKMGDALHFDGATSYVRLPNSQDLKLRNEFTVEAWVNIDTLILPPISSVNDRHAIFLSNLGEYPYAGGFQLYMAKNPLQFFFHYRIPGGNNVTTRGIPITEAHRFYHVAAVYKKVENKVQVKTYVDGLLGDSIVFNDTIHYNNTPYFYIGASYESRAFGGWKVREFPGIIDEVKISKIAREPVEFTINSLVASPGLINFGDIRAGVTKSNIITVANISNDTVTVNVGSLSHPEISADLTSFELLPHAEQSVTISYTPADEGADTTLFTFTSPELPQGETSVAVMGNGYVLKESPDVIAVNDVPNDQGKQVRILWHPSKYDSPSESLKVNAYSVWRKVDDILLPPAKAIPEHATGGTIFMLGERRLAVFDGELWDYIATLPAVQFETYSYVAPTLYNKTEYLMHWTTFRVSAHAVSGEFFFSEADSGYSQDNIYPYPPYFIEVFPYFNRIGITWLPADNPDAMAYNLYRSTEPNVTLTNEHKIATVHNDWYEDYSIEHETRYYYAITTVDSSGNESKTATVSTSVIVLGVGNDQALPTEYALAQNYPNPFNPTTEFKYQLPSAGYVTLKIYNLLGEEVATVVDEMQEAGYKTIRYEASNLSSGLYLYRLTAGSYSETKKMVYIK